MKKLLQKLESVANLKLTAVNSTKGVFGGDSVSYDSSTSDDSSTSYDSSTTNDQSQTHD